MGAEETGGTFFCPGHRWSYAQYRRSFTRTCTKFCSLWMFKILITIPALLNSSTIVSSSFSSCNGLYWYFIHQQLKQNHQQEQEQQKQQEQHQQQNLVDIATKQASRSRMGKAQRMTNKFIAMLCTCAIDSTIEPLSDLKFGIKSAGGGELRQ